MNQSVKGVLLDFNGTLFFDTPYHIEAWHNFFLRRDGIDLSETEIRQKMIGPSNFQILRNMYGPDLSQEELVALSNEKEAAYRAVVRSDPARKQLRPGAVQMMDYLAQNNIPYALVTVSVLGNVEFYLEDLGLSRWFTMDEVVYDNGLYAPKPAPDFYLEAARRIGLTPQECLIAEDSVSGIRSAISAGAGRIIVLTGTTPPEELSPYQGNIFRSVPDFLSFKEWL